MKFEVMSESELEPSVIDVEWNSRRIELKLFTSLKSRAWYGCSKQVRSASFTA